MHEILNKYCSDNIGETGLFLFNPPTGSGKTYKVLEYIFNNYKSFCKDGRKIFFITNLKKNLPFEELRDNFFKPNKKLADFDNHVLFIDSNQDFILKNLLEIEDEVEEYFNTSDFRNLKRLCRSIKRLEQNQGMQDVVDEFKRQIREKYEPNFRKCVAEYLSKHFPNKQDRIKAIKNNKNLNWIGKLYPTVYTDKRKIYFLSIDKFFAKNATLVEPSYYFHENKISQRSLFFIDEFDSTKSNILSNIIDKGINQKIDFIQLFNGIHLSLLNNVFPQQILATSDNLEKKISSNGRILSPKEQLKSFQKKADNICDDFKLKVSYKTVDSGEKQDSRSLLFHDFRYHAVLKGDKKFIRIDTEPSAGLNNIRFVDEKPPSNEKSIIALLNSIKGFINYFQTGIKHLATNYYDLKKENDSDIEFSYESALLTILEEFSLETKHKNFLVDNILAERSLANHSEEKLHYDLSVYQNGFRYYDFVDSEEHDTVTKTFIYSFQNTPEKFILKLSDKGKVVGISATSTMDTVTGNYDINYLSNQLGEKYFCLSDSEIAKLRNDFHSQYPNYDKRINIKPEWIELESESQLKDWAELFEDEEIAKEIFNKITPDSFYKNRILKVAIVFKQFLIKDDIQSFLCLLNAFPKPFNYSFDENHLKEIFEFLIETTKSKEDFIYDEKFDVKNSYLIIKSKDFDAQKEGLIDKLESGKKIFIISTYQTLGAGQNLQFKAPSTKGLVKFKQGSLDWNKDNKTDINAIYLDEPTHLLINSNSRNLKESEFAKYLFQLEFLQEHGDISMYHLNQEVKFAFKNLISSIHSKTIIQRNFKVDSLYQKYNYSQHISKMVIQAIGRLCRTNFKSKNIYIFADKKIYPHIQTVDTEKQICLWEFLKLKETKPKFHSTETNNDFIQTHVNTANTISRKTTNLIRRFLDTNWTTRSIEEWKMLREMTLHFPTLTQEEAKKHARFCQLYVHLPSANNQYSYEREGDFEDVSIDFTDKSKYSVSEQSCRLSELMQIPGVNDLFTSKKWATTIKIGDYMLTPPLFNNIYKGALGEEVGQFVFKKHLGIDLKEIENENYFEFFDFELGDNVYVDFKHWQEYSSFPADEAKEKILEKLNKINGDKVFVVNILSEQDYKNVISHDGRIIEIPFLFNAKTKKFNKSAVTTILSEIEYASH